MNDVDIGEIIHVWSQEACRTTLYLLNFVVNQTALKKLSSKNIRVGTLMGWKIEVGNQG